MCGLWALLALAAAMRPEIFTPWVIIAGYTCVAALLWLCWGEWRAFLLALKTKKGFRLLPKDFWLMSIVTAIMFVITIILSFSHAPVNQPEISIAGNNNRNACSNGATCTISNPIPHGPNYNGTLFAANGGPLPVLEIGNSGSKLVWDGDPRQAMFGFLGGDNISIAAVNGQLLVSTDIHGPDGKLIAELVNNEWQVAPPPGIWDRNYTGNALEVRGPDGNVVLQVKVLVNEIQIQGEWWDDQGDGVRFVSSPNIKGGLICIARYPRPFVACPNIQPLFVYPSVDHLGQLANDKLSTP